jgi:hypothetical protein
MKGHVSEEDLVLLAMRELPEPRAAQARAHLESCRDCRAAFDEIDATLDSFVESRRAELDVRLPPIDPARAALRRSLAAAGSGWRLPNLRLAMGAAAILAVVAFFALGRHEAPPGGIRARFVPDPLLTPGLTVPADRDALCSAGEPDGPPPIDRATAYRVFRLHGVSDPRPRAFELDYLIPPELGGAADVRNLWPQRYDASPWNAHAKDALENRLLHLVCSGDLDLATAQHDLAQDWTAAYRLYFRVDEPLIEHASFLKDQPWE